jgi:hypothetical protein
MKTKLIVFLLVVFAALILADCSTDAEDDSDPDLGESVKFTKEFWGEWIGIHKGGESITAPWYITSNRIFAKFPGSGSLHNYTDRVRISESSLNTIEAIYDNSGYSANGTWMLYPKRTANASFSGNIAGLPSISRAINGVGGIQIVIENLNDAAQTTTTTTDENGKFSTDNAIPGDTYDVTADGETVKITPNADGEDIGTITVASGLNFKAYVTPSADIMLAGGTNYPCSIEIKNIGTQGASACTYQITGEGSESYSGILGTIASGATKKIDISARCNTITDEKKFKKYNIRITDPIANKTWNDSVSLLFYKSVITLTVMTEKDQYGNNKYVAGVIISPERTSYDFKALFQNRGKTTITIPKLKGDYLIAAAGHEREPVYAIDMSVFSTHLSQESFLAQVTGFTDTGNYEPNNAEGSAKTISAPIISYLHTGDLDYYIVHVE